MTRFLALLGILLGALPAAAQQTGVPYFPQVLPAGTIIGRSSATPGPAEAIPFSRLLPLLSAGSITFAGNVTAGNVTANTNLSVVGTSSLTGAVTMGGTLATTGALTASSTVSVGTSLLWPTKTIVTAPTDGQIVLTNAAATGFSNLYLGPATASYPSLNPTGSSGTVQVKLGDGSAFSQIEGGALVSKNASSVVAHQLDINGKQRVGATTAPALTSCGTSPSISGNDHAGTVTMGTTATGCVITFNVAYAAAPYCVVSWPAQALASQSYVVAAATITTTQTSTSGNKINYICLAQSGG